MIFSIYKCYLSAKIEGKDPHVGDENAERGNWSRKRDYILSMIGYAVGLGNIWRFPYLAYKNGGGAFLIPYFTMLVVAGIPLFFLESAFGQFCSQGPINVWRAVPLLQGETILNSDVKALMLKCYLLFLNRMMYLNKTRLGHVVVKAPSLSPLCVSPMEVVYFTATFPYLVILILLIRGVTLEGAKDGIEFYIGTQSNLTKLTEAQVWKDAATQTFYSLSIGWGGLMTLASYNNFHNNVFKDSFVVTLTNAGTSVLAGFAIFSILGHMAHVYKMPVGEVVKEGFGLAFIAYPGALSKLPISPLWSILFFFMLLTVGLDSQFAGIEVLTTCLLDAFPKTFKTKRALLTITTGSILYLLGLPCVTRAGIYWVTLIDQFVASWVLLFLVLLEIIGVSYIYGGNRFIKDIEMMLGNKSSMFWLWWRACWFFISPCIILVILGWSMATFVPPTYEKVEYPDWGLALGWCMVTFVLIWIPVIAVYQLIKVKGNPWKRLKSLCSPSEDWHPYLDLHRGQRYSQERHLSHSDITLENISVGKSWN
uniref:Transporter n=1 Tax=Nothobranchius furzeri TaxID=105023 RepID=A0A8C6PHN6_NOTFU